MVEFPITSGRQAERRLTPLKDAQAQLRSERRPAQRGSQEQKEQIFLVVVYRCICILLLTSKMSMSHSEHC